MYRSIHGVRALCALGFGCWSVGCHSENDLFGQPLVPDVAHDPAPPITPRNTDTFEQADRPAVDVLWVVDNSSSMADEQTAIAENFPAFMEYFLGSGLDYHIGVVSTDMEDPNQSGKLIAVDGHTWIDEATPDPVQTFSSMALLGTDGSGTEQGILASFSGLEMETVANAGFLRDDSALDIIVLSDEEDQSPDAPVTIDEYVEYLTNLRSNPDLVSFSSIVSPLPPEFPCDGANSSGTRYLDVSRRVGGVTWSICDRRWETVLELLGLQATGLHREYFMSEVPVPGTIAVSVTAPDGEQTEFVEVDAVTGLGDWTYSQSRNSITFGTYLPSPGEVIEIAYDVLSAAEHE